MSQVQNLSKQCLNERTLQRTGSCYVNANQISEKTQNISLLQFIPTMLLIQTSILYIILDNCIEVCNFKNWNSKSKQNLPKIKLKYFEDTVSNSLP